jgi:hypothetical protein
MDYQEATQVYAREFNFQKKALLKRKVKKEQPVVDIQNQIQGLKEEKDAGLGGSHHLLPERIEVIARTLHLCHVIAFGEEAPNEGN